MQKIGTKVVELVNENHVKEITIITGIYEKQKTEK